jgi:transposase InsO family protein
MCRLLGFGQLCKETGVRPSMGSVGDCFDNAMCESFFAILECELLNPVRCEPLFANCQSVDTLTAVDMSGG